MLPWGGARRTLKYDSTNKLISAGQNAYTYNAENVRVKNLCGGIETSYVYDTNAKLSKLLVKKTGTTVTKYVYGRGLIGEETSGTFRTYHFDYRGSTVALTNINGTITDTFEYDTYGKLISRTGSAKILFMYNGRDGVVTDDNGLIYMRARYYSPELRRFVNADIIAGSIVNAITLNRYAYANGNPVSFVDPLGLWSLRNAWNKLTDWVEEKIIEPVVETCRQVKDTIVNSVVNTYQEVKDTVVETCNNVKKSVTSDYNEVKKQAVDTYDNVADKTSQVIEGAKDITEKVVNKANEVIDTGVNIATTVKKVSNDVLHIIGSNITASAGICIGMGMAKDNIEAVVRMDIIGAQFKDASVRIGHPGRSAFNVTVPTTTPYADITLGRQNNTFEDLGVKNREVEEPVYFDIGKSYNRAAAFVIGYHYDFSISYLGICQDLYQYFF